MREAFLDRAAAAAAILLLALCAARPARGSDGGQAPTPDRVRTEIPYRDGKVILASDFQERVTRTRYRARGHVEITFQDMTVTSEEAEYDEETRTGFTRGATRFSQGPQWLSCSRAEFDFTSRTGTFYDASGFTDKEILIQGRTIVKTGRDTYRVLDGHVTSCLEKRPKWSLKSSQTNLRVDKTARLRHMVFKIKDVPVLYFPYMVFPMERKTRNSGFLPFHTGNSTSKGRVFTMGYFQTLGRSADATVYGEYFSERGLAMGGVFRVRPSENTRLYVQAYGINDRLDQGGAQIFVDGESRMSNGFRALARVNITTNFRFRQAFADNFRLATIPLQDSAFFLTRNQGSFSTNILFQRNDVYLPGGELVVRKAPSFEFSSLGQPLGNTPLILYFRTSVDALSRRDSLIETPGIVQRLDLYPRIGIRLPSFMGFSLFPRVGVRATYYSSRVTDSETPEIADGRLFRRYADFDLDLRAPILERSFQNTVIGSFRHTVEPVATYRWIHGISNLHETIRFDEEDAIADTSEIEYGVVNRFFRRRQVRPGVFQNHEVLSVAVLQKYFFDPDFGGAFRPGQPNIFYPLNTLTGFSLTGIQRRLAPTSLIARVSPTTTISYDVRADYDTQLQRMRDASVSALWVQSSLIVAGTYFKTHAVEQGQFESNHVQGLIGYGSPLKGLSASLLLSYNLRNSTLLNTLSRVNYMWNCCGLSVEFQQFDLGLRTESRLNFSFTLKGIGNFGNIKRPESLF